MDSQCRRKEDIMSTFLYVELNLVGILLLLLMLTSIHGEARRDISPDQFLFHGVMLLNLFIFVFDTVMWLIDGRMFAGARVLNYIASTCYYLLNALICFWWLIYTDYKIYESRHGLIRRVRYYMIPFLFCAVGSLLTPWTGWFFVIGSDNRYSRGPFFWFMVACAFLYLLGSFGITVYDILKNGLEERRGMNIYLVLFPIIVLIAVVIQSLFFGISIIWTCTMLIAVSIYIYIQNGEINNDYLTGLYNRRRMDQYLIRKIKVRKQDRLLFLVVLDVNNFKRINDTYGHLAGDCALKKAAEILRAVCAGTDDFIARMGGDEFVIIGERNTEEEIRGLIRKIREQENKKEQTEQADYQLSFSIGYSVFREEHTPDSFLAEADHMMYEEKQERKTY